HPRHAPGLRLRTHGIGPLADDCAHLRDDGSGPYHRKAAQRGEVAAGDGSKSDDRDSDGRRGHLAHGSPLLEPGAIISVAHRASLASATSVLRSAEPRCAHSALPAPASQPPSSPSPRGWPARSPRPSRRPPLFHLTSIRPTSRRGPPTASPPSQPSQERSI